MHRSGLWSLLTRVIGVIAALALIGILLRLIGAILAPVLPPTFMQDLSAGWQLLYGIAGPAVPAVMAVIILGALIWIIIGRR
jgi:hypothetical protein